MSFRSHPRNQKNLVEAWVLFTGGASIHDSYNISSVSHTATGTYNIYFDADFKTSNFALIGTCNYSGGNAFVVETSRGTSGVTVCVRRYDNVLVDPSLISVIAVGNV